MAAAAQRRLPLPRHAVADAVENASPWVVNVVAGLSTGELRLLPAGELGFVSVSGCALKPRSFTVGRRGHEYACVVFFHVFEDGLSWFFLSVPCQGYRRKQYNSCTCTCSSIALKLMNTRVHCFV